MLRSATGLSFREQSLKGEACGVLLGLLLGGSFGFGESAGAAFLVLDADFDAKALLMVGAALVGEDVVGLAGARGLEMLLQGGFVVADGSAEGVASLHGEVKIGEGGLDDVSFDEGASGVEAAVEIEGGDDGFKGVGEKRGLSAAAALFFAAAEAEERAEVDAGGDLAEVAAADERGAEASQFALAGSREAAEEGFGNDEAKDGVADELELFVVGGGVGERLGIGLVGERAVGEGPGEQLGPAKGMIEQRGRSWLLPRLAGFFVPCRHGPLWTYFTRRTPLSGLHG